MAFLYLCFRQKLYICVCLNVTGETGSGKTSFINLLLGESDLLPTSLMSNTHAICEIRHGTHGLYKAIFHHLDGTNQEREYSKLADFKQHIAADVQATDANKKPMYKKVELLLPVDILEVCTFYLGSESMYMRLYLYHV